jgi:predicted DNA-binding transcriptional regulator YafY
MWWILGYGDQAEVLAPEELRQMVAGRATRLAALYKGKSE